MNSRLGWHGRLALALAPVAALAVAAPANAATTVELDGGATAIKLAPKAAKALRQAGIRVVLAKPARVVRGTIAFPVAGGEIDPATAKGSIRHRGGLTFRMGRAKVAVRNPTLNTSKRTLTVKLGSKNLVLANVKGGKVTRDGFDTEVGALKLTLNKKAAAALNKAFRIRSIKGGMALGTAASVTEAAEIAIESGSTTLALDARAAQVIGAARVSLAPIAPATADNPITLRFPVTGGTVDTDRLAGTISHSGGISLTSADGSRRLELTNPALNLSATPSFSIEYATLLTPIADVTLAGAPTIDADARTITASGAILRLNSVAAGVLNGTFGRAFNGGDVLGTASLTAQAR